MVDAWMEARLLRLEDRDAIRQLCVDYGRFLDRGDLDAFVGCFTSDGELLLGPLGRARGHAEIRALMERALDGVVGSTFHIISSPSVVLDGGRATAEVMWTVIARDVANQPTVTMLGRHEDELVRTSRGWRFRRRAGFIEIPTTYPTPM